VAVGITVWAPGTGDFDPRDSEHWRVLWNAVLLGLSLPAPLFILRFRRAPTDLPGAGALFALTAGLGAILMMPPTVAARFVSRGPVGAVVCSQYVFPLLGLWYMLAALLGGHLTRTLVNRQAPWSERYGFVLGLLWSPLGAWVLVDLYLEVF
jgi:hypothetical protein